jgi:hypothetical protein
MSGIFGMGGMGCPMLCVESLLQQGLTLRRPKKKAPIRQLADRG